MLVDFEITPTLLSKHNISIIFKSVNLYRDDDDDDDDEFVL